MGLAIELLFKMKSQGIARDIRLLSFDRKTQDKRLFDITNYHLKENVRYRNWAGLPEGFTASMIPSIKKSDLQKEYKSWISAEFKNSSLFTNSTSGSSGIPLTFVKDWACHSLTWSYYHKLYSLHNVDVFNDLEARFYGIPRDKVINNFKERIKDVLLRRQRFPVFDLSNSTLEKFHQRFLKRKFIYLNGYTSSLVRFAEYLIERGIVLRDDCPSLKLCITTSEMCSKQDRITMELGFGVKVVNEYGAAELGILAFEDIDGDWIINDNNLFIEVVDDYDNEVPDGIEGKILVTALNNKAMPFIRYELGDRGVISPHRKNGYRVLEALTGRTNDFAVLSSGKRVPGLTFYYITKSFLTKKHFVKEVIVQQIGIDSFKVIYSGDQKLDRNIERKVRGLFSEYVEPNLDIHFSLVDKIHRQTSGKLKQFERLEF